MSLSIPTEHIPQGMKTVHVGQPFLPTALCELSSYNSKKVFVLANKSSVQYIEGDETKFVNVLQSKGLLAAPLCTSIGMGGGEEGLLQACNEAYAANADVVVTVGGGAVQDAGKFIRLWLSTRNDADKDDSEKCTVELIQATTKRTPMPQLPPQICIPNSFAMAESTHVAGLVTTSNTKSGAAHLCMLPSVIIYDPALSTDLPNWVKFGTALRGIEHAVGAVTHPKATDEVRSRALQGLSILTTNIQALVSNPECTTTQSNVYVGGFIAIRALFLGCYPAIGHLIENQYSARYNVHQGSCSGILCARIMAYHYDVSKKHQQSISKAFGNENVPAYKLVRDLAATLPEVKSEHDDVGVTDEMLKEFCKWAFENHVGRYNALCPKEFTSANDVYNMMTKPLADL